MHLPQFLHFHKLVAKNCASSGVFAYLHLLAAEGPIELRVFLIVPFVLPHDLITHWRETLLLLRD